MTRAELVKAIFAFCLAGGIVVGIHRLIVKPHEHSDVNEEENLSQSRSRAQHVEPGNEFVRKVDEIHDILEDDITAHVIRWIEVYDQSQADPPVWFQSLSYYDENLNKFKFFLTGNTVDRELYCWLCFADFENDAANLEIRTISSIVYESENVSGHLMTNAVGVCDKLVLSERLESRTGAGKQKVNFLQSKNLRVIGLVSASKKPSQQHLDILKDGKSRREFAIALFRADRSSIRSVKTNKDQRSVVVCANRPVQNAELHALTEWIEYLKLLRVDSIVLTIPSTLSLRTLNVLRYYDQIGVVQLWIAKNSFWSKNSSVLQPSRIRGNSLNNCLEFNRYLYDYVLILDTNQLLVPLLDDSFGGLLRRLASGHEADRTYSFSEYLFLTKLSYSNNRTVPFTYRYLYRLNASREASLSATPVSQCHVISSRKCLVPYAAYQNVNVNVVSASVATGHHYLACGKLHRDEACPASSDEEQVIYDGTMKRFEGLPALIMDTLSVFDVIS